VARELLDHGYDLLCPLRDTAAPATAALRAIGDSSRLRLVRTDLASPEQAAAALGRERFDAVVSCIASRTGGIRDSEAVDYGANRQLLRIAGDVGATHFTLLSAICVQKPRLAFQHAKLRFEQLLAVSGLAHSIVRPTAFFKSLSGQVARVREGKPFLLFGDGELTRCKPIAEQDLAQFLRLTLEDTALGGIQPIGGPGPALSPLDQARMLAELAQRPLRTRSVSPQLLSGAARLLDLPGRLFPAAADKAEFARIGHYYATESMLLWDEAQQRYDADATPEFGSVTLRDSYARQLAGEDQQRLGAHAMFD
jgi:divinyl chlorophyllide a 8-vinyl-reductase